MNRACVGIFLEGKRRAPKCYQCQKLKNHLAIFKGAPIPDYDLPRACTVPDIRTKKKQ